MAQSSYNTILKYATKGSNDFKVLVDIKDFPDLGGTPELLETTTLSNASQTYISGIQSMDALQFTANYTKESFESISALKGQQLDFRLEFGNDTGEGNDGVFGWSGDVIVWVNGAGVNEVIEMTVSIAPSTEITLIEE
jgi:hypothetical protein